MGFAPNMCVRWSENQQYLKWHECLGKWLEGRGIERKVALELLNK